MLPKRIVYICCWLLCNSLFAQKYQRTYLAKPLHCSYDMTDGRLTGEYRSYYENGQRKAEGNFENNYRIGKWKLWDSTGKVLAVRNYINPFLVKISQPKPLKSKEEEDSGVYNVTYNDQGFIEYMPLDEKTIAWKERQERMIYIPQNDYLFTDDFLYKLLLKIVQQNNIQLYDEYQFSSEASDSSNVISRYSFYDIIGFKIREDVFFDSKRKILEKRIISIDPVVKDGYRKKNMELFEAYYPDLRKHLAKFPISKEAGFPRHVKSMDDLFFYRCFASVLTKVGSGNNLTLPKDQEEKEIELIEQEHDLWIESAGLQPKNKTEY